MRFAEAIEPIFSRRVLLGICIAALVGNILLTGALAGAGVLKSTEQGDIQRQSAEYRPGGNITVPSDASYRFIVERPTDADAFYNAVVRVRSGGPLYNDWSLRRIQEFHYAPITFFAFAAIAQWGYVPFKFILFGLSLIATGLGTVLLLRGAAIQQNRSVGRQALVTAGVVSLGFSPAVSNFKTGQVTPFIYLITALSWYWYQTTRQTAGGAVIVASAVLKPYFMAPLVLFWRRSEWRGIVGFVLAAAAAIGSSVATFGPDAFVTYLLFIWEAIVKNTAQKAFITGWSVEAINPFWFAGPYQPIFQVLSAVPVGYGVLRWMRNKSVAAEVILSFVIVMLFTLLSVATFIDAAILAVPLLLLGYRAFVTDRPRILAWVSLAFLFIHAHTYVMELTVGNGHINLTQIIGPSPIIALLQPAVYGLAILYGICVAALVGWLDW